MAGKIEKSPTNMDPIINELINKCLEKDEIKRPSAEELVDYIDTLEKKYYNQ